MPEVSSMLCYGILGRKCPMSNGRGMEQLKGIPLLPLVCSEIPTHPVSEAFLMPAGGTDNLHYVTAPCFIRPITVYIYLPVSLLPPDPPISDINYVLCMSVPWVPLCLADWALKSFLLKNGWIVGWITE